MTLMRDALLMSLSLLTVCRQISALDLHDMSKMTNTITSGLTQPTRHVTAKEQIAPTSSKRQAQATRPNVATTTPSPSKARIFFAVSLSARSLTLMMMKALLAAHLVFVTGVKAMRLARNRFPSMLLKPPLGAELGIRGLCSLPQSSCNVSGVID